MCFHVAHLAVLTKIPHRVLSTGVSRSQLLHRFTYHLVVNPFFLPFWVV